MRGVAEHLPNAEVMVDWFHIVQHLPGPWTKAASANDASKPIPRHCAGRF
ncbi:transposase [Chromohalobacter japonicus]